MNKKQLILVIGLGVVLALAAYFVTQKKGAAYQENAKEGAKLLGDFDLNAVATLTLKSGGSEVTLTKKNDLWVVAQRGDYPANFGTISDLVKKLWEIKVARQVKVGPSRLPMLELAGADKGSTLVEMKDSGGKVIRSVLLGAKSMKEGGQPSPFGGGGSWPNGRYVMVGGDIKTVSLVADALDSVQTGAEHWLNKDFFKVEKLKAVTVAAAQATNNFKLTRETESGEWKLADAKGDEKADSSKCSGMSWLLQSASFNDVAQGFSFSDTNKATTQATLETFDGFTYKIKLAQKPGGEDYYMQFAVAADIPKERIAGKDEKKEDKDRLDKEFKEKTDKLKEKLKTEQAFEKWTYVVSKWSVENLLKERKDLLAEKKEEPKKDEAKPEEKK
ncbi:MAG: DUF4340 domain-containing protein [Verrucomicrobia bacterium]|nr:DUF4340 domain-containing protein [Verrucomicrobiota bacterium]